MQLKGWQAWLLSCGVVAIFVLAYTGIMLIKRNFCWDVRSEELTAVIAGLFAVTFPIARLWERITGIEFGGVKLELAALEPPSVDELSGAGAVQMGASFYYAYSSSLAFDDSMNHHGRSC